MARMGQLGAEPELLSFLIADIRGYTAFTHSRGDERAAALAGKFACVAREGIEAHGGRLLELRGDDALGVFSSARASLRAAVSLQQVFGDETRLDPSLPLTVGIGLDAGEVVPVEGGYRGGALNLAARLCSLAPAGTSLASEGVIHLARAVDGITVSDWGTAQVKGLAAPVRALSLAAADGAEPPPFVTAGSLPEALDSPIPMIGRDAELRGLSWAWRRARRCEGVLVAVRGPSGIGKTRLLSAVADVAARSGGQVQHFSLASRDPDWEGLRKALGTTDRPLLVAIDDAEEAAGPLAEALAEAGPSAGRPVLAVIAFDDENASEFARNHLRRLAVATEVVLAPLDAESVRRVVALYVDGHEPELPSGLLESAGGVPRRVHQTVAAWAEDRATRRLGVLARQAAGSRTEIAAVESELAGSVTELQVVRERVRRFGLGPGRRGPDPERAPYKGLDFFGPEDADSFFGRERLVADLIARLAGGGLLAVVGPSGSGKSSLVRAGLLPTLAAGVLPGSDEWTCVVVRPGEHPVRALDVAVLPELAPEVRAGLSGDDPLLSQLAASGRCPPLLVVVDQAEELFTVCADPAERSAFLDGLVAVARRPDGPVRVVVTIRADYYGRFAADQELASALSAQQVLVAPMTREEYRRAIASPAQRHGVTVESALVDALVDDVAGQPGSLPLLSTALLELWEARADRTMELAAYRATGGLHAAVARLADSVYVALDPHQQQLARRMLLRLTGPGVGDAVVKRRVRLTELAVDEASSSLVDLLARRRLLTVSDGAVEVAHEALLREWPRFREWLEEDREGVRLRAQLADAVTSWELGGRDEGELYRGARLSATLDWTTAHAQDLTPLEQEFVTASSTEAQRLSAHQQRQNRRLRMLLGGVGLLLVLALVAGVVALVQRQNAREAADSAETAGTSAVARGAGAEAQLTHDIPTALLTAVAAARLDPSPETRAQLAQVLASHPQLIRSGFVTSAAVGALAVSPDAGSLAVRTVDGGLAVLDGEDLSVRSTTSVGPVIQSFVGPPLAYSPDGSMLAVASTPVAGRSVELLDPETLEPLPEQLGGWPDRLVRVDGIDYTPDGRRVAVSVDYKRPGTPERAYGSEPADQRSLILVWDLRRPGRPAASLKVPGQQGVQLSPDGRIAYVGDPFAAYDVATGRRIVENGEIYSYVFFELNPAGTKMVALPYGQGGVDPIVVDTRTGEIETRLPGLTGSIPVMVSWSPDGRHIAGSSTDGSVAVWDAGDGALQHVLSVEDTDPFGLVFSPDGSMLYTGGANREVQAWDLDSRRTYLRRLGMAGFRSEVGGLISTTPDGRLLAHQAALPDGGFQVSFLDVAEGRTGPPVEMTGDIWFGAGGLSPDGKLYASGFGAGAVSVIDTSQNADVAARSVGSALVTETEFTADGSRVVATDRAGDVHVLDARTLRPVAPLVHFDEPVLGAYPNPRGDTAFVLIGGPPSHWYEDQAVQRWALVDTDRGSVLREGRLGIDAAEYAAFSPDGVHAVAVGRQSQFVVIDVRTGETTAGSTGRQRGLMSKVAYDSDASRFATGANDGSVRLWDARTGAPLGTVTVPGRLVWPAFRPDGTLLITTGRGEVYSWDPSLEAAIDFACRAAGRDMTGDEWRALFGDRPFVDPCPAERTPS